MHCTVKDTLPRPKIAPALPPSNWTHGPPLDPFQRDALTPYMMTLTPSSTRSTVPGAKLFIAGLMISSKSIDGSDWAISCLFSKILNPVATHRMVSWRHVLAQLVCRLLLNQLCLILGNMAAESDTCGFAFGRYALVIRLVPFHEPINIDKVLAIRVFILKFKDPKIMIDIEGNEQDSGRILA